MESHQLIELLIMNYISETSVPNNDGHVDSIRHLLLTDKQHHYWHMERKNTERSRQARRTHP